MPLNFKIHTMRYILIIFASTMFFSCENFFQATLEIEKPETPEAISFSVYVSDEEEPGYAFGFVTEVFDVFEDPVISDLFITDANLQIEDLETQELFDFRPPQPGVFPPGGSYVLDVESSFPQANRTYELSVTHPDFETVRATQVMPEKSVVEEVIFLEDAGIDLEGNKRAGVELSFKDPPGEDFYIISLYRGSSAESLSQPLFLSSTDPSVFQSDNEQLLVEDITFNGESKTILIQFNQSLVDEQLWVDLRKINEAQFRFIRSTFQADQNDGNPFQSPIQIFGNGSNGYGLFAMYSRNLFPIN